MVATAAAESGANASSDGTETLPEALRGASRSGSFAASRNCRLSRVAGSDAVRARSQVASVALASASFSFGTSDREETGLGKLAEVADVKRSRSPARWIEILEIRPRVTTAMIAAAAIRSRFERRATIELIARCRRDGSGAFAATRIRFANPADGAGGGPQARIARCRA
jgi:hypothetical protein